MPDEPSPWDVPPFVTTIRWVKTQDGREIPLRYSEVLDQGTIRIVIEIWPHYPGTFNQIVFRHELIA